MRIFPATTSDAPAVTTLALLLWPDNDSAELLAEMTENITGDASRVFLAEIDGKPVGFAQCQLRHDYVEGTSTSPVGYLEGVYVDACNRRKGVATALIAACEAFSKANGCTEFASDCELGNTQSAAFHLRAGFTEANRVICFIKAI